MAETVGYTKAEACHGSWVIIAVSVWRDTSEKVPDPYGCQSAQLRSASPIGYSLDLLL
jgi:hypothetical protein